MGDGDWGPGEWGGMGGGGWGGGGTRGTEEAAGGRNCWRPKLLD